MSKVRCRAPWRTRPANEPLTPQPFVRAVKCIGTEDRAAESPVLPQDKVYDVVTFAADSISEIIAILPPPPEPFTEDSILAEAKSAPPRFGARRGMAGALPPQQQGYSRGPPQDAPELAQYAPPPRQDRASYAPPAQRDMYGAGGGQRGGRGGGRGGYSEPAVPRGPAGMGDSLRNTREVGHLGGRGRIVKEVYDLAGAQQRFEAAGGATDGEGSAPKPVLASAAYGGKEGNFFDSLDLSRGEGGAGHR